jgi:hypothetical protein
LDVSAQTGALDGILWDTRVDEEDVHLQLAGTIIGTDASNPLELRIF